MLPGPIFNIELLTGSRRTRFYVIRVIYAGILLLTLWEGYPGTFGVQHPLSISQMASFATTFFISFSIIQILAVLLVGPALVAPTISIERERRTIEYLLASDLSNAEIVIGKLLAHGVQLSYCILVGLPILALTGLLGGIDPQRLLITFILTVSTMFTVSALSLGVSVTAARVRDALTRVYLILIAALTIPPALKEIATHYGFYDWLAPLNDRLVDANPFVALTRTINSYYVMANPWDVILTFLVNQMGFGLLIVALATWSVRRVHLSERRSKRFWHFQRKRAPVTDQPILWKEQGDNSFAAFGLSGRIALGLIFLGLAWGLGFSFVEEITYAGAYPIHWFQEAAGSTLTFLFSGGLLLIASRAAASITGEREKDTWIGVLGMPLEAREIVWAKIRGNLRPLRALLFIWGIVTILRIVRMPTAALSIPFTLVTLGLLGLFCSTLGVFVSLVSRTTTRALATVVGILLFISGGYLFCCMAVMVGGGGRGDEIMFVPCGPMLLWESLLIDNVFIPDNYRDTEKLIVPYIIGMVGYGVATAVIYSMAVERFDSLNGRLSASRSDGMETPNGSEGRTASVMTQVVPLLATGSRNEEKAAIEVVDENVVLEVVDESPGDSNHGATDPT